MTPHYKRLLDANAEEAEKLYQTGTGDFNDIYGLYNALLMFEPDYQYTGDSFNMITRLYAYYENWMANDYDKWQAEQEEVNRD